MNHSVDRRSLLKGGVATVAMAAGGCATTSPVREAASFDKEFYFMSLKAGPKLSMVWPGLKEPVHVWMVGDTHFGLHDSRDDAYADNYARMAKVVSPKKPFEDMLSAAKKAKIDMLVLLGDIISFPTLANVESVKQALDYSGVPWMYVAGNHDWHFEGDVGSDIAQRARWTKERLSPLYLGENPLMYSRVVKGIRFVMIDNSVYHVLPEQLAFWQSEASKGDPVCLCMHIPFWTPHCASICTCAHPDWGAATDPYWKIERRERWAERLMPSTYAFRDAVLSTPNLVGIFAGHRHVMQVFRTRGQNQFTVPRNQQGICLDVSIGTV